MFISAPTDTLDIRTGWPRPPRELIAALSAFPVAVLADSLQRMTVMDAGIVRMAGAGILAGAILPVHTRGGDNLAIHRALDDAQPGDVLVISGQGDVNRALIGDLIGEIMVLQGVSGAVVDGAVRDVEALGEQGLAIYARQVTPAGPFKHGPGQIGHPAAVGGQAVNPGDIVVGDGDGIVVIPAARAESVLRQAAKVLEAEATLRDRIRTGIQ